MAIQYKFEIKKESNCFDSIVAENIPPYNKYPLPFQKIRSHYRRGDDLYSKLERGVAILSTEAELNQYLHSFGNMHEAKLLKAYDDLFQDLDISHNKKIEIIDYGCGQGLASIVLLNYIEKNIRSYNLSNLLKVILIEPSEVALRRAKILLNESSVLQSFNKGLDELVESDLKTYDQSIKIHLFSNILDMEGDHFSFDATYDAICKSQKGLNYFICVSALNKNKLDNFMGKFISFDQFKKISTIDGELEKRNGGTPWKIKCNIFKMRF